MAYWLDTTRWLARWVLELTEFEVEFRPRPSIKAQILTDFIMECIILEEPEAHELVQEVEPLAQTSLTESEEYWTLYVDGSPNSTRSA